VLESLFTTKIAVSVVTGIATDLICSTGKAGASSGLARLQSALKDHSKLDPNHDVKKCVNEAIRQSLHFFHAHLTSFFRAEFKTLLRKSWEDGTLRQHGLVGLLRSQQHAAYPFLSTLSKSLDRDDALRDFGGDVLAQNENLALLIQPESAEATFTQQRSYIHESALKCLRDLEPDHWPAVKDDVTTWILSSWEIGNGSRITFHEVLIASIRQLFHDGNHEVARKKLQSFLLSDLRLQEFPEVFSREDDEAFAEQLRAALLTQTGSLRTGIEQLAAQNEETISSIHETLTVTSIIPSLLKDISAMRRTINDNPKILAAQLQSLIEEKAKSEIEAANGDWEKIGELEQARDRQPREVDNTIKFIAEGLEEGADPVFERATVILTTDPAKSGSPKAALKYLAERKRRASGGSGSTHRRRGIDTRAEVRKTSHTRNPS